MRALADAGVDARARHHPHARAVRLVLAGILVAVGVGVAVFVEVPDADEAVRSREHRLRIADVGRARVPPPHHDRLVPAVALDHVEQHPDGGRPGRACPTARWRAADALPSRVEEPDVGAVRPRLTEIEAALVEQRRPADTSSTSSGTFAPEAVVSRVSVRAWRQAPAAGACAPLSRGEAAGPADGHPQTHRAKTPVRTTALK